MATLRSPRHGSRLTGNRAWASPGRRDRPVGRGGRSCSRAQGIADRQLWGQEGIFPRGRWALLPGGFLPSSAALSMTTCQASSGPLWLAYRLLLMHHQDGLLCPAAGGRKAFFPPRWASKCLRGFLAFLCSTQHGPLPGLLWAICDRCRLLLLHQGGPPGPHPGGGSFLDSQGGPQGWPPPVASRPL